MSTNQLLLFTGPLCLLWATLTMTILVVRNRGKHISISHFAYRSKYYWRFFMGFTGVGLMQIVFINAVATVHPERNLNIAALIFTLASFGFILMAYEPAVRKLRHSLCAFTYFCGTAVSAAMIAVAYKDATWFGVLSVVLISLLGISAVYALVYQRKIYNLEMSHILLSYPWVIGLFVLALG
jgi:hypothetical protein